MKETKTKTSRFIKKTKKKKKKPSFLFPLIQFELYVSYIWLKETKLIHYAFSQMDNSWVFGWGARALRNQYSVMHYHYISSAKSIA